jgi:hypothetical protein
MEYRWKINLTGTLPDGHTPDLTITHDYLLALNVKDWIQPLGRGRRRGFGQQWHNNSGVQATEKV